MSVASTALGLAGAVVFLLDVVFGVAGREPEDVPVDASLDVEEPLETDAPGYAGFNLLLAPAATC